MHIDDVRTILRKHLKREPTYDDIAEAISAFYGHTHHPMPHAMKKDLENLNLLRKTATPTRK